MQKAVQISIFPQRCQVNVESTLCFYNFKILQSNLKLKLRSRRNCNEVIPKLSQPLELNKGDPEANSKSLFFSEEMKASRMSEEKERRSYAGRHLSHEHLPLLISFYLFHFPFTLSCYFTFICMNKYHSTFASVSFTTQDRQIYSPMVEQSNTTP